MTAERDRLAALIREADETVSGQNDWYGKIADRLIAAGVGFREDPFWGGPVRPREPVTDVSSLKLDMTEEEAKAFFAAIEDKPADLDVERLARALEYHNLHESRGDQHCVRECRAAIAVAYREDAGE